MALGKKEPIVTAWYRYASSMKNCAARSPPMIVHASELRSRNSATFAAFVVQVSASDKAAPGVGDMAAMMRAMATGTDQAKDMSASMKMMAPMAAAADKADTAAKAAEAAAKAAEAEAASNRKGLEFLKRYPKFGGLSLDMTEPEFKALVKQNGLSINAENHDGRGASYWIATGDGNTVIVMFREGQCSGIQRIRGEGTSESLRDANDNDTKDNDAKDKSPNDSDSTPAKAEEFESMISSQGLEFLRTYPKFGGLSLDMTESEFKALVEQNSLTITAENHAGREDSYWVPTGDGNSVIVMFREGKCSGIQRIRGEGTSESLRDSNDKDAIDPYSKDKDSRGDSANVVNPATSAKTTSADDIRNTIGCELIPEKSAFPLGEPTWLTFKVSNYSHVKCRIGTPRGDWFGQDQFEVEVRDVRGDLVSPERDEPKSLPVEGHFDLPPMGEKEFQLFLPQWMTFTKPGEYLILVKRKLQVFRVDRPEHPQIFDLAANIQVKVLPANDVELGKLIDELGTTLVNDDRYRSHRNHSDIDRANMMLSTINDERTVPWFVALMKLPNSDDKVRACQGLAKYSTDAALAGLKEAIHVKAEEFRNALNHKQADSFARPVQYAAAVALSKNPRPEAGNYLLTLVDHSSEEVRMVLLHYAKEVAFTNPAAQKVIEQLMKDPDEKIRNEAVKIKNDMSA